MPVRSFSLIVSLPGLWASLVLAADPCLMKPARVEIPLPRQGLAWAAGEEFSGPCADVPADKWVRRPAGDVDLMVYADGPSGSGRAWSVTLGVAPRGQPGPTRGTCLATSTLGWRTLQRYRNTPLAWVDDVDRDGRAEVIVWSSFPLREGATNAEFGLMAWVYRLSGDSALAVDWTLSRTMARELAGAYRTPLDSTAQYADPLRTGVAEALERFADERCTAPGGSRWNPTARSTRPRSPPAGSSTCWGGGGTGDRGAGGLTQWAEGPRVRRTWERRCDTP